VKRLLDILRLVVISPELAIALIPFAAYIYAPSLADILVSPMKDSLAFGLTAAALPLGMLAFNYKAGINLLSPTGGRKVLLEWPDYPMLKNRVIAAFVWCIGGSLAGLLGALMVSKDTAARLGVALVVSGILAAAASTATIALARITSREILGE
jgi:hypothetical protein